MKDELPRTKSVVRNISTRGDVRPCLCEHASKIQREFQNNFQFFAAFCMKRWSQESTVNEKLINQ